MDSVHAVIILSGWQHSSVSPSFLSAVGAGHLGRLATASLNENGCVVKGSARVWT